MRTRKRDKYDLEKGRKQVRPRLARMRKIDRQAIQPTLDKMVDMFFVDSPLKDKGRTSKNEKESDK